MLHRFEISLADVDRNVYQDLDLRVARHPSEDNHYLLTRVLAFALEHKDGLAFSKGLSEADEPAIWNRHGDGRVIDWIEVSAPGADRLHRASKACDGGNCTRSGPRLTPSPALSSRNRSSGARARRSFWSCVIVRGSFTANRKHGGVEAAHFS